MSKMTCLLNENVSEVSESQRYVSEEKLDFIRVRGMYLTYLTYLT